MKKKSRNMILVWRAILALLVLAYPFLSCMAQKAQDQNDQQRQTELEVVRKNVVATIFYDTLQAQEGDWTLTKASYLSGPPLAERVKGHYVASINLWVRKDKSDVRVVITEYPSDDDASFPLKSAAVQQGEIHRCNGDECGDEGLKYYEADNLEGVGVGFEGLEFRKGRFFMSISCRSEETAKRFAGYALTAVANR